MGAGADKANELPGEMETFGQPSIVDPTSSLRSKPPNSATKPNVNDQLDTINLVGSTHLISGQSVPNRNNGKQNVLSIYMRLSVSSVC